MDRDFVQFFSRVLRRGFVDSGSGAGLGSDKTMDALDHDALTAPMEFEEIYGRVKELAREALGRPSAHGVKYSIQDLDIKLREAGCSALLDFLTIANALYHAKEFPITVNINADSILSEDFWNVAIHLFHGHRPEDIIFEILEHPATKPHNGIGHLFDLKRMGFRFALDDTAQDETHIRRLRLFGPILDFVKIDGPRVRQGLEKDLKDFKGFVDMIRAICPRAQIIAEFVQNFDDEAQTLFNIGVHAVQGRYLHKEDYDPYQFKKVDMDGLFGIDPL